MGRAPLPERKDGRGRDFTAPPPVIKAQYGVKELEPGPKGM
jgi:hypothetical protein